MDVDWFLNEVAERTRWCDFTPLITTCTDGENGGWFRNVTEGSNFWSAFYLPLLERVRAGTAGVAPTFISDYLNVHGASGEVHVKTGAWNTGWHHGKGFTQWTGSEAQRATIERYAGLSAALHGVRERIARQGVDDAELAARMEEATWHLLRAETSCNIYWGEAWVDRAEADLAAGAAALARAEEQLSAATVEPDPMPGEGDPPS